MSLRLAARRSLIAAICTIGIGIGAVPENARAQQTIVVKNDRGGLIQSRATTVNRLRASGQRVEIRGTCLSACTMLLGASNVCVSPNATLGFHGPTSYGRRLVPEDFEHWSRVMASNYSPRLRSWYMNTGRYRLSGYYRLSGREVINMGYRRC